MKKINGALPSWSSVSEVKGRDWLLQFERALKSEGATSAHFLLAMPLRLTGDASRWHEDLFTRQDPSVNDWRSYRASFVSMWDPEPSGAAAYDALQNCYIKAMETTQQHLSRFRDCVSDLREQMSSSILASLYIARCRRETYGHLASACNAQLTARDPSDQLTYVQLAVKADEFEKSPLFSGILCAGGLPPAIPPPPVLPNRQYQLPSRPVPPPPPTTPTKWVAPPPAPATPIPHIPPTPVDPSSSINRVTIPNSAQKRRQEEQSGREDGASKPRRNGAPHAPDQFPTITCFSCKEKGHYANFCPKRGFNFAKHVKEEQQRGGQ